MIGYPHWSRRNTVTRSRPMAYKMGDPCRYDRGCLEGDLGGHEQDFRRRCLLLPDHKTERATPVGLRGGVRVSKSVAIWTTCIVMCRSSVAFLALSHQFSCFILLDSRRLSATLVNRTAAESSCRTSPATVDKRCLYLTEGATI